MAKMLGGAINISIILICGLILLSLACFAGSALCFAQSGTAGIVINEIKTGETGNAKREFIELYNNSDEAADLAGYTLKKKTSSGSESNLVSQAKFFGIIPAHGFFLIAPPEYAVELEADLVYSGSSYSISGGNTVVLYDPNGAVVDKVGFGEAVDYETAAAIEPETGKSIKRNPVGFDSDDNSSDFLFMAIPTPENSDQSADNPSAGYCGNGTVEAGEECDDGNVISSDGCDEICQAEAEIPEGTNNDPAQLDTDETGSQASDSGNKNPVKPGEVCINELVSDPQDGDNEWIEIYNNLGREIIIDSWSIEEGSGAKTILSGTLGVAADSRFYVIEKPKGNLNNSGDLVILRDERGVLIDQVAYGDWDDGNLDNNAPKAADPYSIARKSDCYDSFNNSNDFMLTSLLTKGSSNIIELSKDDTDITTASNRYDFSRNIIISEIFPDPQGDDSLDEFIELYNSGSQPVDLSGWLVGDDSTKRYQIKALPDTENIATAEIEAGGYFLLPRAVTKIALNNMSDSVKLYQPQSDTPLSAVSYDKAIEGYSYVNTRIAPSGDEPVSQSLNSGGKPWVWSEVVTPGERNIIKTLNHPPLAEFSCPDAVNAGVPLFFDSSDTIDEDGDKLTYHWDFGDGSVNDLAMPEHTYFKPGVYAVKLTVSDGKSEVNKEKPVNVLIGENENSGPSDAQIENFKPADVVISEFLPNPSGADEDGEWIEIHNRAGQPVDLYYWQLDDMDGGSKPYLIEEDIWLEADGYLLITREESGIALNNTSDSVRLIDNQGKIIDNVDYDKPKENTAYARNQDGAWSWTISPTPGSENEIAVPSAIKDEETNSVESSADQILVVDTTLDRIKDFEAGDRLRATGTVAVLPGVLGVQYFYIVGAGGIQIYSYNKDFPSLAIGDVVRVTGELSVVNGEKRLKTKTAADIEVITAGAAPDPHPCTSGEINDQLLGNLISVTGEVVDKKGSSLFLDDGSDEFLIYVKNTTNIDLSNIVAGAKITAVGLVSRTKSGLRILPRGSGDIISNDQLTSEPAGRVMGTVDTNEIWSLPAGNNRLELFKYILIIAGAIILTLSILLFRAFKNDRLASE